MLEQIRPCHMHTIDQGMTPHLLRSTMFAIVDWIRHMCGILQLDDAQVSKLVKQPVKAWTTNMRSLREIRDVTGIHFSKHLLKLPWTLFDEVAGPSSGKMSKLKAFEYERLVIVSAL